MIKDIFFYVIFFTLSFLAGHFLPSYFKRKGQNRADKEDISDIKYLEEKGKNLATKEDIAELTNSIESIKSEISYSNQRQHNIIENRNNCLFEILECAEELSTHKSLLFVFSRSLNMRDKIIELLQQTNKTINTAVKNSDYILSTYSAVDDLSIISSFANTIFLHGMEIVTLETNIVNLIDNINKDIEIFEQTKDVEIGNAAMALKKELFDESKFSQYKYEDNLKKLRNEYILFLRKLFNTDTLLKYKE